jgi:hypothetical protein
VSLAARRSDTRLAESELDGPLDTLESRGARNQGSGTRRLTTERPGHIQKTSDHDHRSCRGQATGGPFRGDSPKPHRPRSTAGKSGRGEVDSADHRLMHAGPLDQASSGHGGKKMAGPAVSGSANKKRSWYVVPSSYHDLYPETGHFSEMSRPPGEIYHLYRICRGGHSSRIPRKTGPVSSSSRR